MLERITIIRSLQDGAARTIEGEDYVEAAGKLVHLGLRTVTPEEAAEFQASVNVSVMMERDAAVATVADRDAAVAELQEQLTAMTAARDGACSTIEDLTATIEALQAEIELLRNPPVNPRVYEPRPFLNAFFSPDEQIAFFASAVPAIVYVRGQLTLAKYVDLDDPDTARLLGMISAAMPDLLTAERVAEIMATGKVL